MVGYLRVSTTGTLSRTLAGMAPEKLWHVMAMEMKPDHFLGLEALKVVLLVTFLLFISIHELPTFRGRSTICNCAVSTESTPLVSR